MDVQTQRRWSKPELVVIARSQPEEAVLTACKNTGVIGAGSHGSNDCTKDSCLSIGIS